MIHMHGTLSNRKCIIPDRSTRHNSQTHLIRQYVWIALRLDFDVVYCRPRGGMDLSTLFLCWNGFPDGVELNLGIVLIRGGWSRVTGGSNRRV